jgi:hypothetical protein
MKERLRWRKYKQVMKKSRDAERWTHVPPYQTCKISPTNLKSGGPQKQKRILHDPFAKNSNPPYSIVLIANHPLRFRTLRAGTWISHSQPTLSVAGDIPSTLRQSLLYNGRIYLLDSIGSLTSCRVHVQSEIWRGSRVRVGIPHVQVLTCYFGHILQVKGRFDPEVEWVQG